MAMKITLLAGLFACCSFAQPPDLIRVVRVGAIQPYVDGRSPVDVVGISALAGFDEEWLIELHDSFASIESLDKALSAAGSPGIPGTGGSVAADEVLPSSRTWIARHRPGMSYRPEEAIRNMAKARYLDVVVYRIPPGAEGEFSKLQNLREFRLDSINSDRPDMVYEIISGAPSGVYISLAPLLSLGSLDEGRRQVPVYAEGAAAGARSLAAAAQIRRERLSFRMEPRLSYVSEGFASPDPDFWHPAPK
jgi:hypothetical protein